MEKTEFFKDRKKLYHFTKFENAIKILESKSLRFGRLNRMNDLHENDKLSFCDASKTIIDPFLHLDSLQNEIYMYRQISLTEDDKRLTKNGKEWKGRFGFDLHQMWGLYADGGNGVCLVFDKDEFLKRCDSEIISRSVSYNKRVKSYCISTGSANIKNEIQRKAKKLFFHKRKEWEHEQEFRLIKRCPVYTNEEYLDYGDSLKYIILSSQNEDKDKVLYQRRIDELKNKFPHIPILIYGNGLLDYSLITYDRSETIWTSKEGYNILIPGVNCELDINLP